MEVAGRMTNWSRLLLLFFGVFPSLGAVYKSDNFQVDAPTSAIAKQLGQAAEQCRKEQALAWLEKELPPWPQPCAIEVKITLDGRGGSSTFTFDKGKVTRRSIALEGSLDQLLRSVLPHEIGHTILADYFGQPLMRWADEGAAIVSGCSVDGRRYDKICHEVTNTPGRAMGLRRLLSSHDYPDDVTALYAQGYSLVKFLVDSKDRPTFLAFIAQGMLDEDWDRAVRSYYGFHSVEQLERAWLRHQKDSILLATPLHQRGSRIEN
jgi:hypothetical protein